MSRPKCLSDGCSRVAVFELRDDTDEPADGPPECYCYEHGPAEVLRLVSMGWTHLDLTPVAREAA